MDPGRAAMIASGGRRSPDRRDITAPRRDNRSRISKPLPGSSSGGFRQQPHAPRLGGSQNSSYMTEDQLSERFVADEDKFVLRQSKKKADIRIRERRAKAIDFLAFNLRFVDEDHDPFDDDESDAAIKVPSPEDLFASLSNDDQLQELEEDIKSFRTLEKNEQNRAYWQALLALCRNARDERSQRDETGRILGSVTTDIDKILSPKSLRDLETLEKQVKAKLRSDEPIDTDYWGQLLKRLQLWKAKATVAKITDASHKKRHTFLQARRQAKATAAIPESNEGNESGGETDHIDVGKVEQSRDAGQIGESGETASKAADITNATGTTGATATADAMAAMVFNSLPSGTSRFAMVGVDDLSLATNTLYEREAARGIGENEKIFQDEEDVHASGKPKWADKFRPRKPRYFNRVQMGYEWNKYNQTHYDHDNPPPKVVQGYQFNIFYPDLIDKTKAPTYHITREGGRRKGESFARAGEEDTCLIRFTAGPPYEDIAFRIVDREWDYSAKRERGFKSEFDKDTLKLHFRFKKIFYRK